MVNTILFQFELTRFQKVYSVCTMIRCVAIRSLTAPRGTNIRAILNHVKYHSTMVWMGLKGALNCVPLYRETGTSLTAELKFLSLVVAIVYINNQPFYSHGRYLKSPLSSIRFLKIFSYN